MITLSQEWDGMLRIVFGRKNKTISANFKTKVCLLHVASSCIEPTWVT